MWKYDLPASDDIKDEDHPVGRMFVQDLESRIKAFGA